MQALMRAVYNAVMEFYDHGKPWKEDFVKFTIDFDEQHPFPLSTEMHFRSKSETFVSRLGRT
jgi:hypothetical protein